MTYYLAISTNNSQTHTYSNLSTHTCTSIDIQRHIIYIFINHSLIINIYLYVFHFNPIHSPITTSSFFIRKSMHKLHSILVNIKKQIISLSSGFLKIFLISSSSILNNKLSLQKCKEPWAISPENSALRPILCQCSQI